MTFFISMMVAIVTKIPPRKEDSMNKTIIVNEPSKEAQRKVEMLIAKFNVRRWQENRVIKPEQHKKQA